MTAPLFGVETEYAISGMMGRDTLDHSELANQIFAAARRRVVHLPETGYSGASMFLGNGARFYVDCGMHPEMTTPECATPWEAARYVKAGDRILEELTGEVQAANGGRAEIMCFRCNVDYSGSGSTWGCHESYLHRADPKALPEHLITHLVTRGVYCGAGGFNPLVSWPEFCVSPRLMHIQQVVSADSTSNRGIFHTKNESLSRDGYGRLHVLCGESLCSETAIVLKIGATALVTALAEAGLRPCEGLRLASPLDALHMVSRDPACESRLPLASGRTATAVEIQRRILENVERNCRVLPPWAGPVCALWRNILDLLENAPDSVGAILDWAIKLRLFRDRAARRGLAWERFPLFGSVLARLNAAITKAVPPGQSIGLNAVIAAGSPIPEEAAKCFALLSAENLDWNDFDRFLGLRSDLYQIDTRFGQIGPRGIFAELDRRGVLRHSVAGIDDVERAMHEPPSFGRGKLRGDVVRRFHGQRGASCTWMSLTAPDGRMLDLSDPFASEEIWPEPEPAPEPSPGPRRQVQADLFADLIADPLARDSSLQQALEAMRRRYARARSRPQVSPETPEGPRR